MEDGRNAGSGIGAQHEGAEIRQRHRPTRQMPPATAPEYQVSGGSLMRLSWHGLRVWRKGLQRRAIGYTKTVHIKNMYSFRSTYIALACSTSAMRCVFEEPLHAYAALQALPEQREFSVGLGRASPEEATKLDGLQ